jgi:glycosyltransferase involved in cell wall biosynthesis
MNPRVSLALPVYNGENFLAQAIEAVLAQTYRDFELIITDNCSSDSTPQICDSYQRLDSRVRYHRNPVNLGAAKNYNRGFELARGEYLKWCAHDDLLSPGFLERCVEVLDTRPDVALVFARTECIDGAGAPVDWAAANSMPPIESDSAAARFGDAIMFCGTCFPIFGLFRMDVLRRSTLHRGYYGSDRALLAEVALLGKLVEAPPDAVFYNREHVQRSINIDSQAERSRWQNANARPSASMEHINLLLHLLAIAGRHPQAASRVAAFGKVLRFALQRRQLGRYVLDLIRYFFPRTAQNLKQRLLGTARTPSHT